jgi:hypothetical protein
MIKGKPHQAFQELARKRRQRQKLVPTIVLIALGVLFIGMAWYFISGSGKVQSNKVINGEDVVYDKPLHAIHEMGPSTLNEIAFLPKGEAQPKIILLEDFHDFGSVGPTEIVNHDFVIANQGEAPLTISRAYTTCGCTTADFTATVIPPGKIAVVTISLDAGFHDVRGQTVRRGIIIENNDPKNPQVELWAQASVRNAP